MDLKKKQNISPMSAEKLYNFEIIKLEEVSEICQ